MKKTVCNLAHVHDLPSGKTGIRKEVPGLSQKEKPKSVRESEVREYEPELRNEGLPVGRSRAFRDLEETESILTDSEEAPNLLKRTIELSILNDRLVEEIKERERKEEELRKSEQELSYRSRVADIFLQGAIPEVYGEVLQIVLELTDSPYGIFSHVDQKGAFLRPAVVLEKKMICSHPSRFACQAWGNTFWARALAEGRSAFCNTQSELPERHLSLSRGMMAPIIHKDKMVGFFGVGNRATDYTEEDKNRLEAFSAYIAPILSAKLDEDALERKRREAEKELEESREQLRALAANLEDVREEERKVIAREIHDEFGQALTCLKMDLSYLSRRMHEDQTDLLEKVNSMMRLIDNNIQLIRDVSSQLRPGILDDFGLLSAIEWQLQSFSIRTGISYRIDSNLDGKELDSKVRTALFRIFQEALTNAVRHSGATEISVELNRTGEGALIMGIDDNGKGISEQEVNDKKSLGILGMRERTVLLGGSFHIESIKDKGTRIQVSVPAPPSEESSES